MAAPPNPFEKQTAIPGVKHIIAVSSGKGGVGKSTVAMNLAMALGKRSKVGLLDADIYGPSIPRMSGTLGQRPHINADTNQLEPITRYGIKLMSIGYLIEENSAVVWRGPMLFKAMDQFLRDVNWGELDYLVVDLPPGTGDIQLTLAQKVPVAGAVMVTTPQNVALLDVKKAVDMYERVNVPLLGMIENMAYMLNPANGEKMQLFPRGDIENYAKSKNMPMLGEIPFNPSVGLACEAGIPIVDANAAGAEAQAFMRIADRVREVCP